MFALATGPVSSAAIGSATLADALAARSTALRDLVAQPGFTDEREPCGRYLDQADRAIARDLPLAALTFIRVCWSMAEPRRHVVAETAATASREAFEAWWSRTRAVIDEQRRGMNVAARARAPLAIQALAESELSTVESYYTAGRLYGIETSFDAGVYYVGRALAAIAFARWLETLPLEAPAPGPAVPPVDDALRRLDASILEAYRAATTAEARRAFIPANTTFKQATDLVAARQHTGALLELLRSTQALGVAKRAGTAAPTADALRQRLQSASSTPREGDASIARLFLERARVAAGDARDPEPTPDERLVAIAILDDVLPAYAAVMSGGPR